MSTPRTKKPSLMEQVLSEQVECGGQIYTRGQLYAELVAEGHPAKYADAFAFGYLKAVQTASPRTRSGKCPLNER